MYIYTYIYFIVIAVFVGFCLQLQLPSLRLMSLLFSFYWTFLSDLKPFNLFKLSL